MPTTLLRTWAWQASRYGLEDQLTNPLTGKPVAASDAVALLLDELAPVLAEYHEDEAVQSVVAEILQGGSGVQVQRQAYARHRNLKDVMHAVVDATHAHRDPQWLSPGLV